MEKAAAQVVGHSVHVTGCGRTDAGVHARCYVANFRTTSTIPVERLPYALNTHLPCDIVVTKAFEVNENFNAIGSCVRKEYTYQIYNSRLKDPFYVDRAWFYPRHLDEGIMQSAASQFVGTHDFAAVRSVGTDVKSTVRTVYYYDVERRGNILLLRVCANGFLYNMARAMAGTVVYAAEGKIAPKDIGAILDSGNRTAAGPTVPAGGPVHDPPVVRRWDRSVRVRLRGPVWIRKKLLRYLCHCETVRTLSWQSPIIRGIATPV